MSSAQNFLLFSKSLLPSGLTKFHRYLNSHICSNGLLSSTVELFYLTRENRSHLTYDGESGLYLLTFRSCALASLAVYSRRMKSELNSW
jgi:hypothetical protein